MKKYTTIFLCIMLFLGCATYKPQYKATAKLNSYPDSKEIAHTFYLIGDAGNSSLGETSVALQAFKEELSKADKNSTALFLGDNIYPAGLVHKKDVGYELAKHRLDVQIDAVKDFKGNPIFIAGNHDWYSGLKGLKKQEKVVEKALGKKSFLPKAGCPIDKIHVTDDIELITVDSHWFLTNWDNHPKLNDNCDIKTRENFFNEFNSLIKKARNKTTIVAIHHPLFTNGSHGGEFSFGDHMKPLPILGTLKNVIRKTSGIANVDIQNKRFLELKKRLVTIAQANETVVFVSGHEHNLQYLIQDNIHQIVSGSGSKVKAVRNHGAGIFGYATSGYTKLTVFKDGSSHVTFYAADEDKVVFEGQVFPPRKENNNIEYPSSFPKTVKASVYTEEETQKSGVHKFLWGDRYRKYYSTKVTAPTVNLDTLFGGVTVGRKGGGNQSKSLRLITKDGKKQYVMRALHKQGVQYLQATVFRNEYLDGQFDNTATEDLVLDVFTGSHPFAPFVTADLSDGAEVYHLNPKLYYIPKQNALKAYNEEFGDELYMIEEHASKGHGNLASFGYVNKILSTDDVISKLHEDEDLVIDEASYIRARLFDMLIGDWDRHQDQWRWLQFKEKGKKVYRPLPRDRDQAFSIMADGALLGAAVKVVPVARLLRKYSDDLVDVKGINVEPYPLDMEFIQMANKEVWNAQVRKIQKGVTDEVIEKAFLNIPEEVRDETIEEIKRKLKARRANLQKISDRYYALVNKYAVIKGTNKDDWFDIERLANGKTKVTAYRIKKGEKGAVFHDRIYTAEETKEIWIYGLDDEDVFNVFGEKKAKIKIRLVGGQNKDTYNIKEGKKITFYDYKSKESIITTKKGVQKLTDSYDTNVYNYKKLKNNVTQIVPSIGSNPDDGFKAGINFVHTHFGFERNPFTSQHKIATAYYFATNGYDVNYTSEFAKVFKDLNLGIQAQFNSPNYATNFFGFGNETINLNAENDSFNLDYNRVKIQTFAVKPSLIWRGQLGASFQLGVFYESNKVERTVNRFIATIDEEDSLFAKQNFYGIDAAYHFENKDNEAFPTLGFQIELQTGYKNNTNTGNGFGYIIPAIGFDYKLIPSGNVVLATNFSGHVNLGNDFEFYQGASLGANTGLRGFRNERFTGKSAFAQSTDLRWNFTSLKTSIVPVKLGTYIGLDYGRIWLTGEDSNKWHHSYGGGFFVNIANMATANISVFNSNEDLRFAFKLGFGF